MEKSFSLLSVVKTISLCASIAALVATIETNNAYYALICVVFLIITGVIEFKK